MFNQKQKIKYFLYARKSSESEDKQMASIESQLNELNKIAKQNKLEVVGRFTESKSAKAPGREVFNEMMTRIKKGEAQGIICWKLNRLARNPIDGGEVSWMIQQGVINHIQTFGRSYYPTDNVIVMAVELGMANQFIRDLSVDTKRGMRNKANNGWFPGCAPLGYLHNPYKRKGAKEIIKDPEKFDMVRRMFGLYLKGTHSVAEVWEIASKDWKLKGRQGGAIGRSTVYNLFTNSFYYREFEYPKDSGDWFDGKHIPMIIKEEYDKIQFLLGHKSRPRIKKYDFAFRGFMRCGECGASITAEHRVKKQKNGNIHYYTHYHCSKKKNAIKKCSQGVIQEKELEKQILEKLEEIEIPKIFKEWVLDVVKLNNKEESNQRKKIISNQQEAYNKCLKRLDKLIDMRADDIISDSEFTDKKQKIKEEKDRLKSLIDDSDKNVDDWLEKVEALLHFAETAKSKFIKGDLSTKKEILAMLGSNLLLEDNILRIETQKPLRIIQKAVPEINRLYRKFEPIKNGLNKVQIGEIFSQSPALLPGSDSNRRPID